MFVSEIQVDQVVTVKPVNGEYSEDTQVRNEDHEIEARPLIQRTPMVKLELVKTRSFLERENGSEKHVHRCCDHLVNISVANVINKRMLTYPFSEKNATFTRLR